VLALDDRTGNILTTIALFVAVVVVAFVARATLVVFVLALLLAYLLEPIVAGIERLLPRLSHTRGASIAVVYVIGMLLVVSVGDALEPKIADQVRQLEFVPVDGLSPRSRSWRRGGSRTGTGSGWVRW
jgi:predicted PurR-regulated permease PerM